MRNAEEHKLIQTMSLKHNIPCKILKYIIPPLHRLFDMGGCQSIFVQFKNIAIEDYKMFRLHALPHYMIFALLALALGKPAYHLDYYNIQKNGPRVSMSSTTEKQVQRRSQKTSKVR